MSVKERLLAIIQAKREVNQNELKYINCDFEPTSKQQIHHTILLRLLDELEEEGKIKRENWEIGGKTFKIIKSI